MNRRNKQKVLGAALAGVSALVMANLASAQQDSWTGTDGNNQWTDQNNWSLGTVPTSTNQAYFNGAGNGQTNITLGGTNQTVAALVFDTASAAAYDIGITAGDVLTVNSNNVAGGFNGTGAISVSANVLNNEEIDASINLAGTAPIITNLSNNVLTFGSAGTSATFNVNITGTNSLQLTPAGTAGSTIVFNDIITGTVGGVYTNATSAAAGKLTGGMLEGGAGKIVLNGQNTYSGFTNFNSGQGTTYQVGSSSIVSGGNIISGPFGTSTLVANSTNTNPIQAVGTNQTIANPFIFITGFTFSNATNTTPYNLTLTGPLSFAGNTSRTFTENMFGQTLTLGGAGSNASTFTLAPFGGINMALNSNSSGGSNSTMVINDMIQDDPSHPATPDTISYGGGGIYLVNALSTYVGTTGFTGGGPSIEINVNTVSSGTTVTSGPFGVGTMNMNNSGSPPNFMPFGADRTVANPITMTSGFNVANAGTTSFNLFLTGPITMVNGRFMNNNLAAGATLYLGSATSPSTITLPPNASANSGALNFQSQSATHSGITVVNDVIQDSTSPAFPGAIVMAANANTVILANANTYSGSTVLFGGTLTALLPTSLGSTNGALVVGNGQTNAGDATLLNLSTNGATIKGSLSGTIVAPSSGINTATINNGGQAFTINQTTAGNYAGVITGAGSFTLGNLSTATLTFSGANNYTGGTFINASVLQAGANNVLPTNGAVTLGSPATLDVNGFGVSIGQLSGTAGSLVALGGGTLTVGADNSTGAYYGNITDAGSASTNTGGTLVKAGSGTMQLAQAGGITLPNATVNGGTLALGDPVTGASGPLNVSGTLTVNDGAKFAILANGLTTNTMTNVAATLTINGSGQLDLANSQLLTTTPFSTVRQYLINGFNNGAWNGTGGITSVNAAGDFTSNGANATRALGFASGTGAVGMGLGLSPTQTLVKFTIYGDADLSGGVDISDLNIVLNNFLGGNTWDTGDMYYSGSTDISDLNAVLNNFFASAPVSSRPLSLAKAHAAAASVSTAHTLTGTASPDANPPTPAFNTLELVVNTSSGDVQIIGNNTQTGDTQITSSSNGIITANWHDLKSQGFSNWQDTAKKAFGIGEFDTQFAATGDFALINTIDYGNIYNTTANAEDYIFKYGAVDQTTGLLDTLTGSVFYVSGVPEPTTLSLLGIGAVGLLARRRRKLNA